MNRMDLDRYKGCSPWPWKRVPGGVSDYLNRPVLRSTPDGQGLVGAAVDEQLMVDAPKLAHELRQRYTQVDQLRKELGSAVSEKIANAQLLLRAFELIRQRVRYRYGSDVPGEAVMVPDTEWDTMAQALLRDMSENALR